MFTFTFLVSFGLHYACLCLWGFFVCFISLLPAVGVIVVFLFIVIAKVCLMVTDCD